MPPKKKTVQKHIPETTIVTSPGTNNETAEQKPILVAINIDNGEHINGESPKITRPTESEHEANTPTKQ